MKLSRRSFMKANAVAAAAAAAGLSVPGVARAVVGQQEAIKWDKAPCRFCGTGCGVLVGTQQGRVVACQGDPDAPVNRGLNCIKGYFLPKIMYGKDRLTQPLLRMKNGKYDKEGEFTPITWDQAFDVMEEKFKTALKEKGPESIGMFGSGQWTIWEGYAASKLFKAGFRSNNIDPNARHCMASAVVGFMRTFGMDEPMGCYDDIEQADAFVLWGANMAEMHPILWSRITNRRLSNQNVTVAVLSTYQHRSFELADNGIIFTPQSDLVILNYIANYIIQNNAINQDFFSKHVNLRKGATDIGYGLRPTHPLEKAAKNPGIRIVGITTEFWQYVGPGSNIVNNAVVTTIVKRTNVLEFQTSECHTGPGTIVTFRFVTLNLIFPLTITGQLISNLSFTFEAKTHVGLVAIFRVVIGEIVQAVNFTVQI